MGLGGVWAHLHYKMRNILKHCTAVRPVFPLGMDHPAAKPLNPSMHNHSWISPDVLPSFHVTCFLTYLFSYSKHSSLILQACPYRRINVFYLCTFQGVFMFQFFHSFISFYFFWLLLLISSAGSLLIYLGPYPHVSSTHTHTDSYKAYGSLARYSCVNQLLYFEVWGSTRCRGDRQQASQGTVNQILLLR